MQQSLPPCPECGGPRQLRVSIRAFRTVPLHACICLRCGHATLRARLNDLEQLRNAAEKGIGKPPRF